MIKGFKSLKKWQKIVVVILLLAFLGSISSCLNSAGIKSISYENDKATLSINEEANYKIIYDPSDTKAVELTYSSSDDKIASVDEKGLVKGIGEGTATITAKHKSHEATIKITVVRVDLTGLSFGEANVSVLIDEKLTLKPVFEPVNASDTQLSWASSDEAIATVDENGVVTGVGKGAVTVTASSAKGFTASCVVNVTRPATWYSSGMYKVGEDIASGLYYVKPNGSSVYIEITSDSSGSFDSIIANENISKFGYVYIEDGCYFSVDGGKFTVAEDAPYAKASNGKYGEGMYMIGRDLPAGEYQVYAENGNSCYIEVTSNASHTFDSIVTNDNFEGSCYITVYEGQYLTINRGYIQVN